MNDLAAEGSKDGASGERQKKKPIVGRKKGKLSKKSAMPSTQRGRGLKKNKEGEEQKKKKWKGQVKKKEVEVAPTVGGNLLPQSEDMKGKNTTISGGNTSEDTAGSRPADPEKPPLEKKDQSQNHQGRGG